MDKMENIDEQLKISIRSILNPVSDDIVTGIIQAIKYAGVESLSDLKYVQEEDLILVLKPVQRRKLIKAWSKRIFHPAESSDSSSIQNCKWTEDNNLLLLQVYSKFKTEFSRLDDFNVYLKVWSKIADEVRTETSLNCNEFQCLKQINELRLEYEKCKKYDATSWTQAQIIYMKHARDVFETTKIKEEGDDKEEQTVTKRKSDVPSKVCFVSPTVSVSSVTTTASAADIPHSIATAAYSDGSSDKESLDEVEIIVPAAKITNNVPLRQSKWTIPTSIKLLQVYAKYRREFTEFGIDRLNVWKKIAVEVNECSPEFFCDGLQCCKRIEEIKLEYERVEIRNIKHREMGDFFDKAKIAFETTQNLAQFSTQRHILKLNECGGRKKDYHLTLLRVYAKYKLEFLRPGADERRVWEKIAKEMREVFSYDCGEFLCRADVFQMLQHYRTLTPASKDIPYYFQEAQQAFGTHNLGIFPYINNGYNLYYHK